MRILVTGGAGFVGAHLCRALHDAGHYVICMDNFFTGSRDNIADLLSSSRFELIRHDVQEPFRIFCHQIYHLACPAAPGHYQFNPLFTMKTSVLGTLNALECAREVGARFLLASTSEVYGDPEVHPQVESYKGAVNCTGPRACYDEGKRAAETITFDHRRQFGTDIRVVRIFNTYGPLMHPWDGRVVSNFVRQALAGDDLTVYGDGTITRSFQYVSDLVEGLVRMMNNEDGFLGPVNLGNPTEFTIRQLADLVLELTGSESRVITCPPVADDPQRRQADITLARERLGGWSPDVPLREGLEKTVAYFRTLDFAAFTPPTKMVVPVLDE